MIFRDSSFGFNLSGLNPKLELHIYLIKLLDFTEYYIIRMKHLLLSLMAAFTCFTAQAQWLAPMTRFHEKDSKYTYYNHNFLSGFMQSSRANEAKDGFLQSPFVGEPLLRYVGEKDSTQFMAYASGYEFFQRDDAAKRYDVLYTRYGVKATVEAFPAYCVQRFAYPDTLAEKGFLLDIDHAMHGAGNEDMDVVFIDKRTIRAYKRTAKGGVESRALYYVAHFSHPFTQWNVRREVVRLENGEREHRCKAAFVFNLEKHDMLTVVSAVSEMSSDDALAHLNLKGVQKHISDERKPLLVANNETPALARNEKGKRGATTNRTNASQSAGTRNATAQRPTATSSTNRSTATSTNGVDFIETTTRKANLSAAFSAAMMQLRRLPQVKRATNAVAFIDAITPLYKEQGRAEEADSLLKQQIDAVFSGQKVTDAQAAWFVFNAIGFVPQQTEGTPETYRVVRPLFNVVTMQLPRTRRFILHTKNNGMGARRIASATLMRVPLAEGLTFTRQDWLKGGVLEIKMEK